MHGHTHTHACMDTHIRVHGHTHSSPYKRPPPTLKATGDDLQDSDGHLEARPAPLLMYYS